MQILPKRGAQADLLMMQLIF